MLFCYLKARLGIGHVRSVADVLGALSDGSGTIHGLPLLLADCDLL